MAKKTQIPVIVPQEGGFKKEPGILISLKVENNSVVAEIIGQKNKKRTVPFRDLNYPHHKARTAAEAMHAAITADAE